MQNQLYYGDNLNILREYIQNESVDLIYLDPPFNSNRNYNVLFREEGGKESEAQITAFEDTWHWGEQAEKTYHDLVLHAPAKVGTAIEAMMNLVGRNQMLAYLVMMTARLVELHRVLKPTGSLYLHCDPTASHYLKIILDAIFSGENFRSEIIWKRTSAHNSAKRPGPVHDVILFYSKTNNYIWNQQYQPYDEDYSSKNYRNIEENTGRRFSLGDLTGSGIRNGETGEIWRGIDVTAIGRHWMRPPRELEELDKEGLIYWPSNGGKPRFKRYLDEMKGVAIQDVWDDIHPLGAQSAERLGYPTQKPVELLERIISASSNEGDVVLDPFCGCGTAISAAQKLGRNWIGIDITHLSVTLQKYRLRDEFELKAGVDYAVIGEPTKLEDAKALAKDSDNDGRYQFQFWALGLVQAKPLGAQEGSKQGKKGSDKGIDGIISFFEGGGAQKVIVQVKSGKVKSGDIRDLVGTIGREKAAIGVFISLEAPSRDMETEAVSAGYFHSNFWNKDYRKLQILTIEDLLKGKGIEMPPQHGTFKQAQRVAEDVPEQKRLI